jgi:hypothetical protein
VLKTMKAKTLINHTKASASEKNDVSNDFLQTMSESLVKALTLLTQSC